MRPIIIFSAFMIPEDVQKELNNAGADRLNVGCPSNRRNLERQY
jgi:4-hydroxy-3-methylbut-2-enyl diphosphate reductase IspH